jgi:hypothetical protein
MRARFDRRCARVCLRGTNTNYRNKQYEFSTEGHQRTGRGVPKTRVRDTNLYQQPEQGGTRWSNKLEQAEERATCHADGLQEKSAKDVGKFNSRKRGERIAINEAHRANHNRACHCEEPIPSLQP